MRRLPLLALPLLLAACPQDLAAPPAPAVPSPGAEVARPKAMPTGEPTPDDPRLAALLSGTGLEDATEEERRLALRIAALDKLRGEMRAILDALPAEKEAAQALEKRLKAVEGRLARSEIEAVLLAAKEELKTRLDGGKDDRSLLSRARAIDEQLDRMVAPETVAESDSETVRKLKLELEKQQKSTVGLAAATRVAFRALAVIEQMKIALPRLEARAAKKG